MSNRIITISRQFGSGGRTIGKKVAEKLGIPCYDSELIEKVAEESGFAKEYIADQGEYAPHSNWFINALSYNRSFGPTGQDQIWAAQQKVILDLAQQGPCVIVGRCADYILRDTAKCFRVFIHAPIAKRAERIVQVYGEREDSPEQRLKDKDRRRQTYYQFYTNIEWGKAQHYNLCLDSGLLGIDGCADLIVDVYQKTAD